MSRVGTLAAVAGLFVAAINLRAQPAPDQKPLVFEVASIREIVTGVRVLDEFTSAGGRAEYHGFSIPMLIAEAWKVQPDQVALSPGVSPDMVSPMMAAGRSARIYEIRALAPEGDPPTRDEFRRMLQSLLATRFQLATHVETREKPVYVLARNGSLRLKSSSGDVLCYATASRTPEGQRIVASHCPIQTLMNNLFVDRPIYDETGLSGTYDFEITAALPFQTNDPQATTPFTAVKDFGLKLEATRRSVETIVIDHVEKPTSD
jgi:uncharacterized protein (TIGR03435 family)